MEQVLKILKAIAVVPAALITAMAVETFYLLTFGLGLTAFIYVGFFTAVGVGYLLYWTFWGAVYCVGFVLAFCVIARPFVSACDFIKGLSGEQKKAHSR